MKLAALDDAPPTPQHWAKIEAFGADKLGTRRGGVLNVFRQLITLFGVMIFHGSITFVAVLCWIFPFRVAAWPMAASNVELLLGVLGLGLGMAFAVMQWMIVSRFEEYPFHLLLARRLRRVIDRRSSPVVRAQDAGARFCEWVPRDRWDKFRLETAMDLVYLKVDQDGVWMEGDRNRFHFPPESILGVSPHSFQPPGSWTQLHATLIYVRTADGPEEFPVLHRDFSFARMGGPQRRLERDELVEAVSRIARGSEFESTTNPIVSERPVAVASAISTNPYAPPRMLSESWG